MKVFMKSMLSWVLATRSSTTDLVRTGTKSTDDLGPKVSLKPAILASHSARFLSVSPDGGKNTLGILASAGPSSSNGAA